ncbi:unnamed protein product [Pylaiella littoralis]
MDLHLGCERRVIFDFVNVIQEQCTLNQALIQDRRNPRLSLLAASQTKDKEALTQEGVTRVIRELQKSFSYVVCDSPAGIESGARHAMYLADEAVIVTNPEVSSCRDSDKMVGFISSKSRRAEMGEPPVRQTLLVTRYDPVRAESNEMLTLGDIQELLGLEVLGVVPESKEVLTATNLGQPVIMTEGDDAATAYKDAVDRFLGKKVELKFVQPKPVGLVSSGIVVSLYPKRWYERSGPSTRTIGVCRCASCAYVVLILPLVLLILTSPRRVGSARFMFTESGAKNVPNGR